MSAKTSRTRSNSAKPSPDVLSFALSQFPSPIAETSIDLAAARDRHDPEAEYQALWAASDTILKFITVTAAADCTGEGGDPSHAVALLQPILEARAITGQMWESLLLHCAAVSLDESSRPAHQAFPDLFLAVCKAGGRSGRSMPKLGELERAIGQFRVPMPPDIGSAISITTRRKMLHRLYQALEPLLAAWSLVERPSDGSSCVLRGVQSSPEIQPHEHQSIGDRSRLSLVRRSHGKELALPLPPLIHCFECGICGQRFVRFAGRMDDELREWVALHLLQNLSFAVRQIGFADNEDIQAYQSLLDVLIDIVPETDVIFTQLAALYVAFGSPSHASPEDTVRLADKAIELLSPWQPGSPQAIVVADALTLKSRTLSAWGESRHARELIAEAESLIAPLCSGPNATQVAGSMGGILVAKAYILRNEETVETGELGGLGEFEALIQRVRSLDNATQSPDARHALSIVLGCAGTACANRNMNEEAVSYFKASSAIRAELARSSPDMCERDAVQDAGMFAVVLLTMGRIDEARAILQGATSVLDSLSPAQLAKCDYGNVPAALILLSQMLRLSSDMDDRADILSQAVHWASALASTHDCDDAVISMLLHSVKEARDGEMFGLAGDCCEELIPLLTRSLKKVDRSDYWLELARAHHAAVFSLAMMDGEDDDEIYSATLALDALDHIATPTAETERMRIECLSQMHFIYGRSHADEEAMSSRRLLLDACRHAWSLFPEQEIARAFITEFREVAEGLSWKRVYNEALPILDECIPVALVAVAEWPELEIQSSATMALLDRQGMLRWLGRRGDALWDCDQALQILDPVTDLGQSGQLARNLCTVLIEKAGCLIETASWAEAIDILSQIIESLNVAPHPEWPDWGFRAMALRLRMQAYLAMDDRDRAAADAVRWVEGLNEAPWESMDDPLVYGRFDWALHVPDPDLIDIHNRDGSPSSLSNTPDEQDVVEYYRMVSLGASVPPGQADDVIARMDESTALIFSRLWSRLEQRSPGDTPAAAASDGRDI